MEHPTETDDWDDIPEMPFMWQLVVYGYIAWVIAVTVLAFIVLLGLTA